MKRIAAILAAAVVSATGCAGYTYNGVRLDDLKTVRGASMVAAGVATTYAVHTLSHIAVAEICGEKWHFDGLSEIVDGQLSDSEARWFARAGFVGQLAVGYGLKLAGVEGPFVRGYNSGTAFEIMAYPITNSATNNAGDDIGMINDHGGNGDAEWAVYYIMAAGLNIEKED